MDDYQPLNEKELERAYFFVRHKLLFRKILFILAIVILAIIYISLIFKLVNYFQASNFNSSALKISNTNIDWQAYHQSRMPQEIIIGQTQTISLGNGKYNLVVAVENPNKDWILSKINYHFLINGQTSDGASSFLNPQERKFLLVIAYESNRNLTDVSLEIDNITWQRVDSTFPIVDFAITNVKYKPLTKQTVDSESIDVPARVVWQAENLSLYNFWEVSWQVALYNGSRLVGINQIVSKDFLGLEKKELEAIWLNNLSRVSKAEVFIILDKLDKDNFKNLSIDPGSDTRERL